MKTFYAVFDTNVLVSSLISNRVDSPTVVLLDYVVEGRIVLLYNEEILAEYEDVLHRHKFGFDTEKIEIVLGLVMEGLCCERVKSNELFSDEDDAVFYEVAGSKEDAFLVTGNLRHFPKNPIVVSPAKMLEIVENFFPNFALSSARSPTGKAGEQQTY